MFFLNSGARHLLLRSHRKMQPNPTYVVFALSVLRRAPYYEKENLKTDPNLHGDDTAAVIFLNPGRKNRSVSQPEM